MDQNNVDAGMSFSVVAIHDPSFKTYTGQIYINDEVAYEYKATVSEFPGGIDDFTSYTVRMFTRKLRSVLSS